jgi:hypothetical protein
MVEGKVLTSGRGVTGRRARFKPWWAASRAGSNPAARTFPVQLSLMQQGPRSATARVGEPSARRRGLAGIDAMWGNWQTRRALNPETFQVRSLASQLCPCSSVGKSGRLVSDRPPVRFGSGAQMLTVLQGGGHQPAADAVELRHGARRPLQRGDGQGSLPARWQAAGDMRSWRN